MILDNFWKILVLVIVIVSGFFWWKKRSEEKRFLLRAQEVVDYIDPEMEAFKPRGNYDRFQKQIYIALAHLHNEVGEGLGRNVEIRTGEPDDEDGISPSEELEILVQKAGQLLELRQSHTDAMERALRDGLATLEEHGVFRDDGRNLDRLERGKPPVIKSGPYEGHELVVAPVISPLVVPEVGHDLANFTLVPAPVRALMDERVSSDAYNAAYRLKNAGLITDEQYERVELLKRSNPER